MHEMGLRHDRPHKKSARVVGETLGKYHPHGDQSVYMAMVRMAQDFAMRHPLIDGQGNFGSIDGDVPAAMRYTEARLAEIAEYMLQDIDQDTVDFVDNFDGSLQEPTILPTALPNLLVNGATGIAVGMATNIPPHNLGEICDAVVYVADNWGRREEITVDELMEIVPGPDFPTGGMVYRYRDEDGSRVDTIRAAYETGRGRIVTQARVDIEGIGGGKANLVVTELPYGVQKSTVLERIAHEVREGRISGVTDLRDESDYEGMRVVIEVSRMADPRQVLEQVLARSQLRETCGVNSLALVPEEVNGQIVVRPRLLSLRDMLIYFIEHRLNVIVRRSRYELEKRETRLHIVQGLLKALDVIQEVIDTIRRSRSSETAEKNLIKKFKFTPRQAEAIMAMQLRRLAALERRRLADEERELKARIRYLRGLLRSEAERLEVVVEETLALKERFATPRRTVILTDLRPQDTATAREAVAEEEVWVVVGADGQIRRWPRRRKLGRVYRAASLALLPASTRDDLFLLAADGRAARIPVHRIPEEPARWSKLCGLGSRAPVAAALALDPERPQCRHLFLATRGGRVKRIAVEDLLAARNTVTVMGLNGDDELAAAVLTPGDGEIILVTRQGKAIRFRESEVRVMGLPAAGVGGIRLDDGDAVVACGLARPKLSLVTVSERGYGKRTPLSRFPTQGRYGKGVVAARLSARTGSLVGAVAAGAKDTLLVTTARGQVRRVSAGSLASAGRTAQGQMIVAMGDGAVISVSVVRQEE